MELEQYLVTAIGVLAGCVGTLFVFFKMGYDGCVKRELNCQEKYEHLLERIAKIEPWGKA